MSNNTTSLTKSVVFIEASDLVPEDWKGWFWGDFSSNAPFSWGDNNRTLITAERFRDHADYVLEMAVEDNTVTQDEANKFLEVLIGLDQTYIDLEN